MSSPVTLSFQTDSEASAEAQVQYFLPVAWLMLFEQDDLRIDPEEEDVFLVTSKEKALHNFKMRFEVFSGFSDESWQDELRYFEHFVIDQTFSEVYFYLQQYAEEEYDYTVGALKSMLLRVDQAFEERKGFLKRLFGAGVSPGWRDLLGFSGLSPKDCQKAASIIRLELITGVSDRIEYEDWLL